jgi:hypothetical protein
MFLALIMMVVVEWFSFEVRLEAILGLYISSSDADSTKIEI